MAPVEEEVGRLLTEMGLTIAVAEARTAGLVGSMLCSVPGSSPFTSTAGFIGLYGRIEG